MVWQNVLGDKGLKKQLGSGFGNKWLCDHKFLSLSAIFGINLHTGPLESLQLRIAVTSCSKGEFQNHREETQPEDGKMITSSEECLRFALKLKSPGFFLTTVVGHGHVIEGDDKNTCHL